MVAIELSGEEGLQGNRLPGGRRALLSRLISFRFLFFFLITRC